MHGPPEGTPSVYLRLGVAQHQLFMLGPKAQAFTSAAMQGSPEGTPSVYLRLGDASALAVHDVGRRPTSFTSIAAAWFTRRYTFGVPSGE